jgi:hypothetical protein
MSKFKSLIIILKIILVGLVLLYIAFGRKKKKREEEEPSEGVTRGDNNNCKANE